MKRYRRPSEPPALVIARRADSTYPARAFALFALVSGISLWLLSL